MVGGPWLGYVLGSEGSCERSLFLAQFGSAQRKTHVDLWSWHGGVSTATVAHGGRGGRCVRAVVHLRRRRRSVAIVATD